MEAKREFKPEWSKMLVDAVQQPGTLLAAYSNFHNYSLRNSIFALMQCSSRRIQPGPIACFNRWKELGRHVMKGQKAISVCMPITIKKRETVKGDDGAERTEARPMQVFTYKNNWFVLAQTGGQEYQAPALRPGWNKAAALGKLDVAEVPFRIDQWQGYATERPVGINPIAALPHKTLFHELAHVALGHTEQHELNDTETLTRDVREVEAESVAMICCEALNLEGAAYCRGYIQNWIGEGAISDGKAARIFDAADKILKAWQ
jgi:hypothetical protein